MAPTIQNEMEAGRAAAAMTETTRPTRMASRQLSAEISKRVGADWVAGVTDMARGYFRYKSSVYCCRVADARRRGFRTETAAPNVTSLDQSRFRQQVLLELGDIVQGRLGILLAGDGEVELVLLLGQQLEELRHVPHVLLPIQRRRPGPVPGAVSYVFRIRVHGLDGRLTAGRRKLMLDVRRQPPLHEFHGLLDLYVGRPGGQHEGLAANI